MTPVQDDLLICIQDRWVLGFNDPYLLSWIMVAIYVLTAALAVAVARRGRFPAPTHRRERAFWAVLAGVLILMAINKQADLQTLVMATGRCVIQTRGWGDQHVLLKGLILTGLVLAAFGSAAAVAWALLPTLRRTALPLLGVALMAVFIVFRAAETLNVLGPLRALAHSYWPDRILELSGPAVILVAAYILLSRRSAETQ